MSTDLIMTLTRNNNRIATAIPVQMDTLSNAESSYYGGSAPYFRFAGYTLMNSINFQFQDLLTDTQNIDPRAGQLAQYRVISQPEYFPDSHVELVLDKVVGT